MALNNPETHPATETSAKRWFSDQLQEMRSDPEAVKTVAMLDFAVDAWDLVPGSGEKEKVANIAEKMNCSRQKARNILDGQVGLRVMSEFAAAFELQLGVTVERYEEEV
jgi:hypothetical protein